MATPRTYLAFDYGTKRIGLAIGNDLTSTAQAIPAIATPQIFKPDGSLTLDIITHLVKTWKVNHLVFGAPLDADGKETQFSRKINKLGMALATKLKLPASFADERYSSGAADHIMRAHQQQGKKLSAKQISLRDSVAAQLILESYLSHPGNIIER